LQKYRSLVNVPVGAGLPAPTGYEKQSGLTQNTLFLRKFSPINANWFEISKNSREFADFFEVFVSLSNFISPNP